MEERAQQQLKPALLLVVVLGPLLLAGIFQLVKAGGYLTQHGDSTFPESAVVQTGIWAHETGRIYPGLNEAPYTPAPYGPLFYVALAGLAKVVGGSFDRLVIAGRVLTFAGFLLVAVGA